MQLQGKGALVTGAGSGIGRAVALAYAGAGAQVLVADIDDDAGRQTVQLVHAAGGQAAYQRLDVSVADEHQRAVAEAERLFGALHVACNNAGISGAHRRAYVPLAEVTLADWTRVIDVNLSGVFYGLKAQLPALVRAGGGAVVNLASVMGQVARECIGPYVASKHGVLGLTRAAALDHARQGVRVNAVAPGYIDTPMVAVADARTRQELVGLHPLGRLGRVEEVAALVLWLSTDAASFVTGSCYPVDGGYLAQ